MISLVVFILSLASIASTVDIHEHLANDTIALQYFNTVKEKLQKELLIYGEQTQKDYLYEQMQVRSQGGSGLKQIRNSHVGLKNYHEDSHNGFSVNAIHDHANYKDTLGMGEVVAVLNGVEFQTRHNDYRLVKPASNNKDFHAVEEIAFPNVPTSVTEKATVAEQVAEMKEYFKAFQNQDTSIRNYIPYFKPVLCYMEGAWMNVTDPNVHDFPSDKHHYEANTWFDLQEQARFAAYSGAKGIRENIAYLPTQITGFKDGHPVFSRFNYRILCHPIDGDLPLNRFQIVDDMSSRKMTGQSREEHATSASARFVLNRFDNETWAVNASGFYHQKHRDSDRIYSTNKDDPRGLLDDLMLQIPGKDNYPGEITTSYDLNYRNSDIKEPVNVARYHRWIKTASDEMRTTYRIRGFGDMNMFTAYNTQQNIATIELCRSFNWKDECRATINEKVSYAIPLEIVYLTPLHKWNPYDVDTESAGVAHNSRTGDCTSDSTAYNGADKSHYYLTPANFFKSNANKKCVLNRNQNKVEVKSSGIHTVLPEIEGVGIVRQRYPIAPIHGEGSAVWKELNALKDYYAQLNDPEIAAMKWIEEKGFNKEIILELRASSKETGFHSHQITLVENDITDLKMGRYVTKLSTKTGPGIYSHDHVLLVKWSPVYKWFEYYTCDKEGICKDGHPRTMRIISVDGKTFDLSPLQS